jgi:hypothetical protein
MQYLPDEGLGRRGANGKRGLFNRAEPSWGFVDLNDEEGKEEKEKRGYLGQKTGMLRSDQTIRTILAPRSMGMVVESQSQNGRCKDQQDED